MEWIKVSDRLPEENQYVLFIEGDRVRAGRYTYEYPDKSDLGFFDLCCLCDFSNVTHWMPLPSFPKEPCPLYESDNCNCHLR